MYLTEEHSALQQNMQLQRDFPAIHQFREWRTEIETQLINKLFERISKLIVEMDRVERKSATSADFEFEKTGTRKLHCGETGAYLLHSGLANNSKMI